MYDKNKKQYSIKIPKEIAEIFKIEKKDIMRFIIQIREGEAIKSKFNIIKKSKLEN